MRDSTEPAIQGPRTSESVGVHGDTAVNLLSAALLANQLPPIAKFSGDGTHQVDGETFSDWYEQFELCASVCHWDVRAKLFNLVTRLKGPAYGFYKSCSAQQRADYEVLVTELKKRFTPVRIQSVQSSLFYEKKQESKESVDDYAQALRKLFAPSLSQNSTRKQGG